MFPNSQPFKPLDQNSLYNQNLWGYAYDTAKGNGYPIPPPREDLIGGVAEHCGSFCRREIVVPTTSNVYAYDTWLHEWRLRGRFGPFYGYRGPSTYSNGNFYRCDTHSYNLFWNLHVYDAPQDNLFHMRLPKLDFMSDYCGKMFLVPIDDSKLCILWQKKFSMIGKSNLYYCKIKISFDHYPSATILEQKRFEYLDIWDVVNYLPIDSVGASHLEEIRPLSKIDLHDNTVRVEKVRTSGLIYPGTNYLKIGEKHQPRIVYPFSSSVYNQSPDPLITSSESIFSKYKGYLVRGKHLLQKLKK